MSGLLAGDELAIVGAERDGAVGVPDQIEEAVGRPLIRYIIFILQEIVLASFLVWCGGGVSSFWGCRGDVSPFLGAALATARDG